MGFMGELFNSTPTTTIHPYTCDVNEEHLWQYIKKNKKWKWRRIQISSEYIILNPGRHRYIVVVSCGSTSSKRGDGGGGVELVKGKSYPINVLEGEGKSFSCVYVGDKWNWQLKKKTRPRLYVFLYYLFSDQ